MDNKQILRIEERFQESRAIEEQVEFIEQQIDELNELNKSLEDLKGKETNEVLTSVGKGVYMRSEITDKTLFVDVGAGTIVKKTPGEVQKIIQNQIGRLREVNFQLNAKVGEINSELEEFLKQTQDS